MRVARYVGVGFLVYVLVVVLFEAYLGIFQPKFDDEYVEEWDATIVVTTIAEDGSAEDRVVVPMVSEGDLYVSANHWPRSWYRRAMKNPQVRVTSAGQTKDYLAVPIPATGTQHDRLLEEHPHPAWFRFMTGFPPRRFVRLEPGS